MEHQHPNHGPFISNDGGESSDLSIGINVKTLDSQTYSFQVQKNMPVSLFKERISTDVGVPVGQQRLIFRGKVLKDDHLLSDYHLESGHTLHLVERQLSQSQPSSNTNAGETNGTTGAPGNDGNPSAPRNRIGQISHSVLLGTVNVGDQGDGVPDISRVIGAVMNSIGIGSQSSMNGGNFGAQFFTLPNTSGQNPQGNETNGTQSAGGNHHGGTQAQSGWTSSTPMFQVPPQSGQIPMTTAAIPSFNLANPNSLTVLSEYMNIMESLLSLDGSQLTNTSAGREERSRRELPTNERGLPTPEALGIIMRDTQRLLSNYTITALSHLAGRLEQEGNSSDPHLRLQIQNEVFHIGLAMQHLGSFFLELGRAMMALHMGQSTAESSVNSGPALYVSRTGANPLMVQPSPQPFSLLGSRFPYSTVGAGSAPRNVNIHIHAGTSLAPVVSTIGTRTSNGDGVQRESGGDIVPTNSISSGLGSRSIRVLPVVRNVIATVPSSGAGVGISTSAQSGVGVSVSQQPPLSESIHPGFREFNSLIQNAFASIPSEMRTPNGSIAVPTATQSGLGVSVSQQPPVPNSIQQEICEINSLIDNALANIPSEMRPATVESLMQNNIDLNRAPDLATSQHGVLPSSDGTMATNEANMVGSSSQATNEANIMGSSTNASPSLSGGDLLSSSKSESTSTDADSCKKDPSCADNSVPLGLGLGGLDRKRTKQLKTQVKSSDGGSSSASLDRNLQSGQQLLQSLASRGSTINRTGVSDPSGQLPMTGNIRKNEQSEGQDRDGQLDPSTAMAQVLGSPEVNDLLSGLLGQTGGGSSNNLTNMLQQFTQSPQIMNTVNQIAQQIDSQDLGSMFSGLGGQQGGGIDLSQMVQQMMPVVSRALSRGSAGPESGERRSTGTNNHEDPYQIGIQQLARSIERSDPPPEVFRAIVETAARSQGNDSRQDLVDEVMNDATLINEYAELLQHDLQGRLQDNNGGDSR